MPTASLVVVHIDKYVLVHQRTFKTHCGQGMVGVPGGHMEPQDKGNPLRTALREAHEEVGYYFGNMSPPMIAYQDDNLDHTVIVIIDRGEKPWNMSIEPLTPDETLSTFTTNPHHHKWVKVGDIFKDKVFDSHGRPVKVWHRTKSSIKHAIEYINFCI